MTVNIGLSLFEFLVFQPGLKRRRERAWTLEGTRSRCVYLSCSATEARTGLCLHTAQSQVFILF